MLEKLQLQDERNLLIQGLPSAIEKQFAKLSYAKNVTPLVRTRKVDFALVFAINQNQLINIMKEVMPALKDDTKLWVAYPKVTSKIVSDLNRESSWDFFTQNNYEGISLVDLDHMWSAMRFKKSGTTTVVAPKNNDAKEKTTTAEKVDYTKRFGKSICKTQTSKRNFFITFSISPKRIFGLDRRS
ncbi:MAG: hypothetical protein NTZ59_14405 [Bacteroidetes bacterium]|nr:hypothetical protein [Bacteroidota bacterium]